ncbi:MAG: ribosome recycling factor [Candidatus Gracilibacteria bacterium]|nr:ribosome recycling factor [Candidatus Gracilibacteria bacterium]
MLGKTQNGIEKSIHHLEMEFSKLQAGRANPAMIEDIRIDSYGSLTPIKNIASINTMDSQTLSIMPWDKSQIHSIAKAITDAGIGLNPQTMADSVLIRVPALTEDRRKELCKISKKFSEDAKVSVRTARQDSLKDIKTAKDAKEITEDDVKDFETKLQKMVDEANKKIDEMTKKKDEDIMKI